jgi:spore germination protein PA/spore germination protein PF
MPAFVGNIKIVSVGSGAVVQFGDAVIVSPSSASKTFAGSGSFVTGDVPVTNNGVNATNTLDPSLIDSSVKEGPTGLV